MKNLNELSHILLLKKEMDLIRHVMADVVGLYDCTESFLEDYLFDAPHQYSKEEIEQLLELLGVEHQENTKD